MPSKTPKVTYKRGTTLGKVGFWATAWWAVSWLYLLMLVFGNKEVYIQQSAFASEGFFSDWWFALKLGVSGSPMMQGLLAMIVVVWIVLFIVWTVELRKANISFKAALKDLFFSLR